jgi:16S rRNA (adenine1518-N6/adenine1519-N6)-dimethyltransferase
MSLAKAKKSWGQHFLMNEQILSAIASAAGETAEGGTVVELGAGTGNLTKHLLLHSTNVIAYEMERGAAGQLTRSFGERPGLEVIRKNILDIDFESHFSRHGPLVIAGNLPFNISKRVLVSILHNGRYIKSAFLMFQKEVAERILALPGTREWGPLGIFSRLLSRPSLFIEVEKDDFVPPPKVRSTVVRFDFDLPQADASEVKNIEKIVKVLFTKRRKTLRNILRPHLALMDCPIEFLTEVDLAKRPGELDLDELKRLSGVIHETRC